MMKPLRIGCGELVHLGTRQWSTISCRIGDEARTLCGAGGPFGGPPIETQQAVTCPDCLRLLTAYQKEATA